MSIQPSSSTSSALEMSEEALYFFEALTCADSRVTDAQRKTIDSFRETIASLQAVEKAWADWLITLTNEETSLKARIAEKTTLLAAEKTEQAKALELWNNTGYRWQREIQGKVVSLRERQASLSTKYDELEKSHNLLCQLKKG